MYHSLKGDKMPLCSKGTKYLPASFAWTLLITVTTLFFYFP